VDTSKDTTLDHGALVAEVYSIALGHRHSAVRETAIEFHFDMIENPLLPDVIVMRRYMALQALIARCRRVDRERAKRTRRAAWWAALRLAVMCAVVLGVSVIAAALS
jgi:hypothetical protein